MEVAFQQAITRIAMQFVPAPPSENFSTVATVGSEEHFLDNDLVQYDDDSLDDVDTDEDVDVEKIVENVENLEIVEILKNADNEVDEVDEIDEPTKIELIEPVEKKN